MTPTTISAAKQMTAAYAPLGAVMVPEDIYQAYVDHSATLGTFGHGYTYGGHPLGCAVGVAALDIYQKRNILDHVRRVAPHFQAKLASNRDHPLVGEARGSGLMGAIEVAPKQGDPTPFETPAKGPATPTVSGSAERDCWRPPSRSRPKARQGSTTRSRPKAMRVWNG